MTELQKAMATLTAVFYKYSEKDGDKKTMTKGEFKELVRAELGMQAEKATDQAALDKIFLGLDFDRSGKVDFQEYIVLISSIIMCYKQDFP